LFNFNLSVLGHFINSNNCTAFDIKYGIILNELESYKRQIHTFSRKNDIACHNEQEYAMYDYIKNENWVCYRKATSVLKLRSTILKHSKNSVTEVVTAFYFEYINNSLSKEFIEPEYIQLVRKLKLAQIFSE
jgi:hypothetical protein